ncbi:hypothetical protein M427DRAFT_161171 [Gonapodya prolifera JEL478]|uniref:Uncharacterized protein n=1 Tax=Gonapodya prolifera (strain JEL478) TaxID=1344416 RepID=A0A138ZXK9_GONPJ|nr:hypothetical protein M427DRAFT_161171 [Gonapodya prolifera JEL478]|eukprot:KXS09035.1 hypothetical protein M427DRAFT_161171 [Gonapodya prolifera JEL478]
MGKATGIADSWHVHKRHLSLSCEKQHPNQSLFMEILPALGNLPMAVFLGHQANIINSVGEHVAGVATNYINAQANVQVAQQQQTAAVLVAQQQQTAAVLVAQHQREAFVQGLALVTTSSERKLGGAAVFYLLMVLLVKHLGIETVSARIIHSATGICLVTVFVRDTFNRLFPRRRPPGPVITEHPMTIVEVN